ncbi:uncharacterized protein LOC120275307 [Dioscorea cayenensis subsp. rotundata]|uniref:Uncharacterized protein LOC120275307 n=1 Tax=Dioscorea cayennensis subsp. rotundata TaxID=55577 RepID=A0AB40CDW6_DIOCR|nr:uncharacterized protein LOC120275307 [Dioscorea cayenensis subsp. rotundata]
MLPSQKLLKEVVLCGLLPRLKVAALDLVQARHQTELSWRGSRSLDHGSSTLSLSSSSSSSPPTSSPLHTGSTGSPPTSSLSGTRRIRIETTKFTTEPPKCRRTWRYCTFQMSCSNRCQFLLTSSVTSFVLTFYVENKVIEHFMLVCMS